MSSYVAPESEPRIDKLAQPKKRIDKNRNFHPFKIKPEALSYEITDTINKLAQPKRRQDVNRLNSNAAARNATLNTGKVKFDKLADSSDKFKITLESKHKQTLIDTYARVVAARNKRCSKRLKDLARPKLNHNILRSEAYDDFDNDFRTIKKYEVSKPGDMSVMRKEM